MAPYAVCVTVCCVCVCVSECCLFDVSVCCGCVGVCYVSVLCGSTWACAVWGCVSQGRDRGCHQTLRRT